MKKTLATILALLPFAATAEDVLQAAHQAIPAAAHHEGLSLNAVPLREVLGFPITNSMVVTWMVTLVMLLVARLATSKMTPIPGPLQNLVEWVVEGLYNFLEGIMGEHLVKKTFWFFASLFLFILGANWMGLVPGVGTIGWGEATAEGFRVSQPLFRGVNADLNMTLAMAVMFFALWVMWAVQCQGPWGVIKHLFGAKGDVKGAFGLFLAVVFLAAGMLEVVSILFRPISLSLRLFGNVYAGETMLETMSHLVPSLAWLIPIPFYFMELMVGLVQALVFMLLTAVFTMIICEHHEDAPAGTSTSH